MPMLKPHTKPKYEGEMSEFTVGMLPSMAAKTLQRTGEFRFQKSSKVGPSLRLQECWFCRETGESEWQDIQIVDENGHSLTIEQAFTLSPTPNREE